MSLIDLTLPLYDHMPVYPGDPEVKIAQVHTLEKEGWNMATVSFPTHIATHVNVPLHMMHGGKTLDDYDLDAFMGPAVLYSPKMMLGAAASKEQGKKSGKEEIKEPGEERGIFNKHQGVIFTTTPITQDIAEALIKHPPKFIGLSDQFEFDVALEKLLLEHGVISYENLTNTDQLPPSPKEFFFYGLPLKIRSGDGSPVRAFAEV